MCFVYLYKTFLSLPEIIFLTTKSKEAFMFVRLTFCKFLPEKISEARKVYHEEVMPALRKQTGLLHVRFLEPTDKSGDYVSITEWSTKADAELYDASGLYKKLVNKLEAYFVKQPELKTYTVEDIFEHA
jgi:quinol monooxygenase YgiN